MKNQVNKNFLPKVKRRMVSDMINNGINLAEKLGPHPLTKGCNCIHCVHKRKRILHPFQNNWKYQL